MNKKEYISPAMTVLVMNFESCLLASSSDGDCENPWWCDNQPSPDDWWKKDE